MDECFLYFSNFWSIKNNNRNSRKCFYYIAQILITLVRIKKVRIKKAFVEKMLVVLMMLTSLTKQIGTFTAQRMKFSIKDFFIFCPVSNGTFWRRQSPIKSPQSINFEGLRLFEMQLLYSRREVRHIDKFYREHSLINPPYSNHTYR